MKEYKIFYEYYPFNMDNINPKSEIVTANSLEEAFIKLKELKGKDEIEIFEYSSRRFYKE